MKRCLAGVGVDAGIVDGACCGRRKVGALAGVGAGTGLMDGGGGRRNRGVREDAVKGGGGAGLGAGVDRAIAAGRGWMGERGGEIRRLLRGDGVRRRKSRSSSSSSEEDRARGLLAFAAGSRLCVRSRGSSSWSEGSEG